MLGRILNLDARLAVAATTAIVASAMLATACGADPTPTATPMPIPTPTSTPVPSEPTMTASEQLPAIGPIRTYELRNTQEWLNGEPTTIEELRRAGEVVLVDFWTYT